MSIEEIENKYGLRLKKVNDELYLNQSNKQEVNCHEILQDLQNKILIVSDAIRKERKEDGFTYKIAYLYCILSETSSDEFILECFNETKAKFGNVFIMAIENTDDTFQEISTIYGEEERRMY